MGILLDHKVSAVCGAAVNSVPPLAHIMRASLKIVVTFFLPFRQQLRPRLPIPVMSHKDMGDVTWIEHTSSAWTTFTATCCVWLTPRHSFNGQRCWAPATVNEHIHHTPRWEHTMWFSYKNNRSNCARRQYKIRKIWLNLLYTLHSLPFIQFQVWLSTRLDWQSWQNKHLSPLTTAGNHLPGTWQSSHKTDEMEKLGANLMNFSFFIWLLVTYAEKHLC